METRRVIFNPSYTLTYNGVNITADIAKYLVQMRYEDTVEGETDALEVTLENEDGLWSNGWYPEKGAKLVATIGNLDCGEFEIDEIELGGPPDTVIIRALANIVVEGSLKTKRSRAHESKTLAQIAQAVAQANGLTVQGTVPNILIERVTQKRERDLKFLRRISWDYGIIFNVRGSKLIYMDMRDIDNREASISLDKTQLISYKIKDKTSKVYKAVEVKYHNPKTAELITAKNTASNIVTVRNADNIDYPQITSGDTLVIHKRVENKQQAEAVANAALYRANTKQQEGTVSTSGNELLVAGNNVEITGLGVVGSGVYNMTKTIHTVDRDNDWIVDIDIKRVSTVSKVKQRGVKHITPKRVTPGKQSITQLQNKDNISYPHIGN